MNNKEINEKVKNHVRKNKTEDALQLLSDAQLTVEDRFVLNLTSRYNRVKEDWIAGQISKADRDIELNSINQIILDLMESNSKADELIERLPEEVIDKPLGATFPPSTKPETIKTRKKKPIDKRLFLLLLLIPLIGFIFSRRTNTAPKTSGPIESEGSAIASELEEKKIWPAFPTLYSEDFSNPNGPDFNSKIWNTNTKSRDYTSQPKESKWYAININKQNYGQHKYIGVQGYDPQSQNIPYLVSVFIDGTSNCKGGCLGRGPSVRYNKSKDSVLALTLNDDGVLRFSKIYNFKTPDKRNVLFEQRQEVKPNTAYQLGIINIENTFFLYFNNKLIKKIEENSFYGTTNGVIAGGKGLHLFNEVKLYKPIK